MVKIKCKVKSLMSCARLVGKDLFVKISGYGCLSDEGYVQGYLVMVMVIYISSSRVQSHMQGCPPEIV